MNLMTLSQSEQPAPGGFRVDVSRGQRIGRVSSEWFTRPDDERYLNLSDLYDAVRARAERAQTRTVESREIQVEASRKNPDRLTFIVPEREEPVTPTHWSFGQLCTLVGAPTSYLRQLPAVLSAVNLQHGLLSHRAELVKILETDNGRVELRAVTGPDYGRIWDHELVAAVMKIAGNGTGDTRWKVPGIMDWSTMTHNPMVDVTKDTTTLYASDRDVFLFLVDDTNPIEAGKLPDGSPDLYFRGFYCWNSEVGSKSLGRLHEPKSLGCGEFRRDHYPAFQVCGAAFCLRGCASAYKLCQFVASALRCRSQGSPCEDCCPHRGGPRALLAQGRVFEVRDLQHH
jgi:hypothetical protein